MSVVRCSNRLCKKEISDEFEKCPFCGEPITEICERVDDEPNDIKEDNNKGDELNGDFWSMLWKFLHLYEKISPTKAYLLLGGEIVLGIGFVLLGWLMSSNSGYRGNSTGALGFLIGGILLFYSLYAIIKHTTKQLMIKKDPNIKEIKIRAVALLVELITGGLLFLIGNGISDNRDAADMLRIIAVGIASVAILSMLKFLVKILFGRDKTN